MKKNEIKGLRKSNFLDVVNVLNMDECGGDCKKGEYFKEIYDYYPWEIPTIEVIKLLRNKGEFKKNTTLKDFLELIFEYNLY